MCLPSGVVLMIIGSLFFNCLHCVAGASTTSAAAADAAAAVGGGKNSSGALNSHVRRNDGDDRIGLRIDITRKQRIHVNGVEIDENSLVHHLEDHERKLIFGNDDKLPRALKLVQLRHLTDVDSGYAVRKPQLPFRTKRAVATDEEEAQAQSATKRQNDAPQQQQREESFDHEVSVEIKDNDHMVSLKLQKTSKLIDDSFIFLRRYANFTQFIEDSHKLAEIYEHCFYSNENAALDLCDDETVRGVFQHNSTDFIIQPLPARFGKSTHVILETEKFRPGAQKRFEVDAATATSIPIDVPLQEHFQFEPDLEAFNSVHIKHASVEQNIDELQRTTRNTETNSEELQGQGNAHEIASKNSIPLNLNLSYKPRFTESDHHQHHHRQRSHKKKSADETHHNLQYERASPEEHRRNHHHSHHHNQHHRNRKRRYISTSANQRHIPSVLHIETAIFVDNDLVDHMSKNFPKNTERQLMRFVLAIINGVQLLYHHPTLGRRVNFVLKRLEILYKDPPDLGRSSDIDTYLNNFCLWQRKTNPTSDSDPLHYDHAVILTGLDLYVVVKNGKMISQVVGLAPVAGMCTPTSSCTINEGKHFESVFVVAHEIGHNLGMRHDTSDTGCDPSSHIMSPTLGTGKITWSKCSRTYLDAFLETDQAHCLFDRSQSDSNLDHSAEGLLPGERFNADKQCMLKYGRDSVRAKNQPSPDICRDLHCQRDRYTWTSHPALDGTECGDNMWCRSGSCVSRPVVRERNDIPREPVAPSKSNYEKASFYESNKREHLLHEYNQNKLQKWGAWSDTSECDSGCLYGPSNRLREGSTGLRTYVRRCLDRRRCLGHDKKYESCIAKQCYNVKKTTIEEFATSVCEKAKKFDTDLTGRGEQITGDIEESCKVFCKTKNNRTKSRVWTFPDGTTCHSKHYSSDATAYCIGGRCERFSCDNTSSNYYKIDPKFCRYNDPPTSSSSEMESRRTNNYNSVQPAVRRDGERNPERDGNNYNGNQNRIYGPTTVHSKSENEVAVRHFHEQAHDQFKHKSDSYSHWNKYNYRLNDHYPLPANQPVAASLKAVASPSESEWVVKSGCHSSCMAKSKGVQVVTSRRTGSNNIQLCTHTVKPCDHLLTPSEYAENTCARYKLKVRGLSGFGTQIAASVDDPDRSCRVGCQDEYIKYRFYLVNGKYGHFPLGTKCSNSEERYCVNGKCLEFGSDDIPLQQSHISLALYRNRRSIIDLDALDKEEEEHSKRYKRSFLHYAPINITETITQEFINSIVNSIINYERKPFLDDQHSDDHIEFTNPIHMSMDELSMK